MFTPSHIGGHVPPIDFGKVFDVPRLTKALKMSVVEWHQVKNLTHGDLDELGCWNLWEAVQEREIMPRRSAMPDLLKLGKLLTYLSYMTCVNRGFVDISYTKAPTGIKLIPRYEHDQHASFSSLAALAFPETRAENLVEPRASPYHAVKLPPDEQVLCYDYLYYVSAHQVLIIYGIWTFEMTKSVLCSRSSSILILALRGYLLGSICIGRPSWSPLQMDI